MVRVGPVIQCLAGADDVRAGHELVVTVLAGDAVRAPCGVQQTDPRPPPLGARS